MCNQSIHLIKIVVTFMLFAFLAGCGGRSDSTSSTGTGAVTTKLVWATAKNTAAKSSALAPAGVTTVRFIISGADITPPLTRDFAAADGQGTFSGIKAGSGRNLAAQGLGSDGTVLYQGSSPNNPLTIVAGQTTEAGTIVMTSATVPDAPVILATAGDGFVTLSWSAVSGATSYNVTQYIMGVPSIFTTRGITGTSYTSSGLSNGTTYNFYVRAENSVGVSASSNEVTATPTASGSYSNETLSGAWIFEVTGDSPSYFIADGNGNFTEVGGFSPASPPGTYQIDPGGSFSMTFLSLSDPPAVITGSLSSTTSGSGIITGEGTTVTMTKVTDSTLWQGDYSGSFDIGDIPYSMSFAVDSSGLISNFSSSIPGVTSASGKAFAIGNNAVMTIRTNATTEFSQINAWGTLASGQFTGSIRNHLSVGTVSLFRIIPF